MAVSDKLRKKLEKRKEQMKSGGGLGYMTFKEGTTPIRILSLGTDEDFGIEATRFYASRELGGIISGCTFGDMSPILEKYKELKNSENDEEADAAENLKPKKAIFVVALKIGDNNKPESEPQLALISKGVYEELIDLMLDEDNGDFTDPRKGYIIKIKRTGQGLLDTEYKVLPGKPLKLDKKLSAPQDAEAMVRKICATPDEEEQYLSAYLGDLGMDEGDGKPKKKVTSKKRKKVSDISDDEDTPKKKKVTKKKVTKKKK